MFSNILRADLERSGVKRQTYSGVVDFHALRHTFLTMASKTMDVKTLQEIAGHTDICVTMRYYTQQLTSDLAEGKRAMAEYGAIHGAQAPLGGTKRGLTAS